MMLGFGVEDEDGRFAAIEGVDPAEVNKLIAEELNGLSLTDRERVLEEVHGVKTMPMAGRSDDGIFDNALREMQEELDACYFDPHSHERADGTSTGKNQETRSSAAYSAYREARSKNSELVSDLTFQRAFLLAEDSNAKRAADRMVEYLDYIRDLYDTSEVLFRPIFLDDLGPSAKEQLVMGSYQILPERDSSGRRVFCYLRDMVADARVCAQVFHYFAQRIIEDEDGMVAVAFLHNSTLYTDPAKGAPDIEGTKKLMGCSPWKFSAIHLCFPDRPFFNIIKSAILLGIGKGNRSRVRLHVGSHTECHYSLRPFGIPVNRLPVALEFNTTHRKDNITYHTKWLRMQKAKESAMRKIAAEPGCAGCILKLDHDEHSDCNSEEFNEKIEANKNERGVGTVGMRSVNIIRSQFVECPRHEDCLFGRGRNTMKHPGNVAMRRLLDEKRDRYTAAFHHSKAEIAWEVVNAIKSGGGRFLKESNIGLYTLVDNQTARKKISIAFRDLKSKSQQKRIQRSQNEEDLPLATVSNDSISPTSLHDFPKRQKFEHVYSSDDSLNCSNQICRKWL